MLKDYTAGCKENFGLVHYEGQTITAALLHHCPRVLLDSPPLKTAQGQLQEGPA